ncbi:ABC transporter permease [Streptomyces lunalinharesii]|uniref:ABC transporter permease subunit n=1 Tax=Streptomyces lunalinharesii TaxID=333384 RepID=A0ABN3RQJ1_9ACTN
MTPPDAPAAVRGTGPDPATGAAPGYRAARTLRFGVELRRQLLRRRTLVLAACSVLLPVLLLVSLRIGHPTQTATTVDYEVLAAKSAPNFVMYVLFVAGSYLNAVFTAVLMADSIAGEAAHAGLKYLLAIPVPRLRLLWRKAVVSGLLTAAVVSLGPLAAVVLGTVWLGTGDLMTPSGYTLPFGQGLSLLATAQLYAVLQLVWLGGLALLLSVSTDAPLAAVGCTVLASTAAQILDQVSALGALRDVLPSHHTWAWMELLSSDPGWSSVVHGVLVSTVYACGFGVLAAHRFARKDITS